MTGRRALTAALAGVILTAGVACSNTGTTDVTLSSPPTVVTSTAVDRPTTSAVTSSSAQPSISPVSTAPTASNPWPDDLTPEQVADAQAALTAYHSYWQALDQALADPGRDWTAEMAGVAIGPEYDLALKDFAQSAANGQRAVGTTVVEPVVTKVEPALITITACVDKSNTDILDSSGNSVKAPDALGSYFRHVSVAQVGKFDTKWLVTNTSDDWNKTC